MNFSLIQEFLFFNKRFNVLTYAVHILFDLLLPIYYLPSVVMISKWQLLLHRNIVHFFLFV